MTARAPPSTVFSMTKKVTGRLLWLARLSVAFVCGLFVFLAFQIAGNRSGVGQAIYILLYETFGAPQTIRRADCLFSISATVLCILALIPATLTATNIYRLLDRCCSRFSLPTAFIATTGVCVFSAVVLLFANSEVRRLGLPKAWLFSAIYCAATWRLLLSLPKTRSGKLDKSQVKNS